MAITHPKSLAHTHVGVWIGLLDQCKTYSRTKWIQALHWMWISITKLKVTDTVAFSTTFYYQDSTHSQMVNSISVYNTVSKQFTSTAGKYTGVDCPMLK